MTAARAMRASIGALLLCLVVAAFAQLASSRLAFADVAVPQLTGRVVDQTGTLSAEATARLEQKLKDFEARKGSQIAVLLVPTTAPETIEQFAIRVAEQWKIGRSKIDDGAILLVAKNDRKLRIEVGYGLEGALTDVTAKRIIDEIITPKFRNGDFSGGIEDGVDRIISVIDGEPLPKPEPQHEWQAPGFDPSMIFNPFFIIGALVLGHILRMVLGRLPGALVAGGIIAVIAWFMVASFIMSGIAGLAAFLFTLFSDSLGSGGGGRSGGWSGGGGSWSGGSGGSSSGGFSGGGGSFGGGGASGSW
ncbi:MULTISPECIES: YgcG family protein [Rhodopseudomonas]|uniref:Membrane protein n=1 Tax=Rhodopseudomonas palustris TaxID=1076 RepID=A0A0D7F3M5_RHOPL|nr:MULTISPECIES: YgcG family protein [Rhodopseudomonas]KIZ47416.1 membrane protein [Rhodopseudomonas palustris]MDF3812756.1 YgcG family protein [Rhodopseudomonas sp. BAL398]WOK20357.1 YgcG family protein [Rhodopseudomonas sp. BAL398]